MRAARNENDQNKKQPNFHNLLIRPNIGEFLGCILFSFMACFAGQYQRVNDGAYPLLCGLSLYISRSLVGDLTPAHLNPAVTILQWLRSEIPLILGITFIFVQLVGFLFGVTLFRTLVTQTEFNDYVVMYEIVSIEGLRKINRLQAFILEIILSLIILLAYNLEHRQQITVATSWGFIQFVSYPLYGFSSNFLLLLVTSSVSAIFSPITTPSFSLIYLNVFASLVAVFLAFIIDLATRPALYLASSRENADKKQSKY